MNLCSTFFNADGVCLALGYRGPAIPWSPTPTLSRKSTFPGLSPTSAILVAVFDFFMAFLVYIGLVINYGYGFFLESQYLIPLALLLTIIATFGPGTLIAALNLEYRDFRYLLPFTI